MYEIIRSDSRGSANHGWLDSRHTFSFADYHDPQRMGFGSLRVINEDRIEGGTGFGTHPHRDMEIVTYIIDGELQHKDSMGNGSVIRPGELQRMTAGTGVFHSEINPCNEATHLLQIWILPDTVGLEPGYEQKMFPREDKLNRWCLLGSRDGRRGSLTIHQDVELLTTVLEPDARIEHRFGRGRRGYLHVLLGDLCVGDERLVGGDGMAIENVTVLNIEAKAATELLLFDMA